MTPATKIPADHKPLMLTDSDVLRLITPVEAVSVMESVFLARAKGTAFGIPRVHVQYPAGNMTITPGGVDDVIGHRTYVRENTIYDDQLVTVWDRKSGRLRGLIVGALLGVLRTGSIGGVAVKYLPRFESTTLAIVGTSRQAFSQVQAALAVRVAIREIRVYSRTPENRAAFIEDMQELYQHKTFINCETAEAAVRGADIVIGATSSRTPVIKGEWLKAGAHVTTIGPKSATDREVDAELVARADVVVTDSPEQLAEGTSILDGSGKSALDLSAVVSKMAGRPSEEAITLFVSMGLAGTEVALAQRVLDKHAQHHMMQQA